MEQQDKSSELLRRFLEERPVSWDALPDLNLYMDQVISYLPRQLIHFGEEDLLTAAMVNNYSKVGLLPRAEGKKYTRTHLAYLTAICALKQVLSVKEIGTLLSAASDQQSVQELYQHFCAALDKALSETAQKLPREDADAAALPLLALELALTSYANKLACQQILEMLQPPKSKPEKGKGKPNSKQEELK